MAEKNKFVRIGNWWFAGLVDGDNVAMTTGHVSKALPLTNEEALALVARCQPRHDCCIVDRFRPEGRRK